MKKNENEKVHNPQDFLVVEEALSIALKASKSAKDINKIYVWRQRYKEGKLSHKKISEILEAAGFVKAVEEKWIYMPTSKNVKRELEISVPLAPESNRGDLRD